MEEIIYPIGYDIKAEQTEGGNWRLSYTEKFGPDDLEAVKNTMQILKFVLPDETSLELYEDRIVIQLKASRNYVMNYLAGEFLAVSSLGSMQLNEVLAMMMQALTKHGMADRT